MFIANCASLFLVFVWEKVKLSLKCLIWFECLSLVYGKCAFGKSCQPVGQSGHPLTTLPRGMGQSGHPRLPNICVYNSIGL